MAVEHVFQSVEFLIGQLDLRGVEVFNYALLVLRAGDRHDVRILVQDNYILLLNRLTHFIGFLELVAVLDGLWAVVTAGEYFARKLCFLKAVDPALQTLANSLIYILFILGGSCQQIDITELIVARVQGVGAVDHGLHLTAHLVVIDRRCPYYDLSVKQLFRDFIRVVIDDAMTELLTGKTPLAKANGFFFQRNELHLVAGLPRTVSKGVRK